MKIHFSEKKISCWRITQSKEASNVRKVDLQRAPKRIIDFGGNSLIEWMMNKNVINKCYNSFWCDSQVAFESTKANTTTDNSHEKAILQHTWNARTEYNRIKWNSIGFNCLIRFFFSLSFALFVPVSNHFSGCIYVRAYFAICFFFPLQRLVHISLEIPVTNSMISQTINEQIMEKKTPKRKSFNFHCNCSTNLPIFS